MYNLFFIGGEV